MRCVRGAEHPKFQLSKGDQIVPNVSPANVATVAIVVHGVGDHTPARILSRARNGLAATGADDIKAEEIKVPHFSEYARTTEYGDIIGPLVALQVTMGNQVHLVLPIGWSRLRLRTANEADHEYFQERVHQRLFNAFFFLLPSTIDALRCVTAAPGVARRLIVLIASALYAVLAPGIVVVGFLFAVNLVSWRVLADLQSFEWWRIPALVIILWLLNKIATKVLMVLDFSGDIAAYIGNSKHRRDAEEYLLKWPAPGSEDTELGVLMEPEVGHGKAEVYTRVQA